MFEQIIKNRNLLTFLLSLFIFILIFIFSKGDIFHILDKKIQHFWYSAINEETQVSKDIIIVEIDDKTLDSGELGRFPFDRKDYVPVIEHLSQAGAAVIGFDIIFSEKTDSDELFVQGLRKAGNVLIGGFIGERGEFYKSIFDDEIIATGFFQPKIDPVNHVVYSIYPKHEKSGQEHFSLSVLKAYYSHIYSKDFLSFESKRDDFFYHLLPNRKIPLARKGENEILINFINRDEFKQAKSIISFIDVYDKARFENIQRYTDFQDKIVLIGAAATGIKDIFYTPNGIDYGVYTHANMLNTIIKQNYLSYFNSKVEWLIIFLLVAISVYFNLSRSGYVLIASNISIASIFIIFYPIIVIEFTQLMLSYVFELLFALILSLMVSNIVKYIIENRHKTKLNKALGEYVSKDIAAEILSGAGKINLNGESKKITLFFSDIEGFTTFSEKLSPEKLVAFLRAYLSEMSNIIMDERGFINKYEGDAIMALWGVFTETSEQNTYDACRAALLQQRKIKEFNKAWTKKGMPEIKVRMGIHLGEAIIGNIGAEGRKMEFTALGDNVNLASRLEGVNKYYGTYICVSEDIHEALEDRFEFRYLDKIRVKGKENPIKIYELLAHKGELSKTEREEVYNKFEEAVYYYGKQNFSESGKIFEKLVQMGDVPSQVYMERCQIFLKNPPQSDWDGVWTMQEK